MTLHLDCGQAWGCVLVQVVDMDRLDSLTLRQMQRYIRATGVTDLSSSAPDESPDVTMSWPNLISSGGVLPIRRVVSNNMGLGRGSMERMCRIKMI